MTYVVSVPVLAIVLVVGTFAVLVWQRWRWSIWNFRKVVGVAFGDEKFVAYVHKSAVERHVRGYLNGRIELVSRIVVYERPITDPEDGGIDWTHADGVCRYNEHVELLRRVMQDLSASFSEDFHLMPGELATLLGPEYTRAMIEGHLRDNSEPDKEMMGRVRRIDWFLDAFPEWIHHGIDVFLKHHDKLGGKRPFDCLDSNAATKDAIAALRGSSDKSAERMKVPPDPGCIPN